MSLELHNQILEEFKKITQPPFDTVFLYGFAVEQVGFNLGIAEAVVRRVLGDPANAFAELHKDDEFILTSN